MVKFNQYLNAEKKDEKNHSYNLKLFTKGQNAASKTKSHNDIS